MHLIETELKAVDSEVPAFPDRDCCSMTMFWEDLSGPSHELAVVLIHL